MVTSTVTSFITFSKTATNDSPFRLLDTDLPFYDANIHAYTQNALYGDMTQQLGKIFAEDVAFFQKGNLKEVWFKNAGVGANTNIVAVCTVPTTFVKQELGLI